MRSPSNNANASRRTDTEGSIRISAVIPTYGQSALLRAAVESVLAQDLPIESYELIVVDNNPRPKAEELVQEVSRTCGRAVRYVHEPRLGLHNARHAGARAAKGPIVALTDDDAVCAPSWLGAILEAYDQPEIACVGGKLLPRWESPPPKWLSELPGVYLSLLDHGPERKVVDWRTGIYGCNFSVRKDVLYQVGGFNPECVGDQWLGDGETGLLRKVEAAGWRIVYTPDAVVYHVITRERATLAGMRRRFANFGANDSYIAYRELRPSKLRLLLRAAGLQALSVTYLVRASAARVVGHGRYEWYTLRRSYFHRRSLYELQLVYDAELCKFVERENWVHES